MDNFFDSVAAIIEQARAYVGRTADLTMCVTYFEVGRMIVEQEQGGKARAEYGRGLMRELAKFLTSKFGHGFSISTLKNARKFYQIYAPTMRQIPPGESGDEKSQTMFSLLGRNSLPSKSQTMVCRRVFT